MDKIYKVIDGNDVTVYNYYENDQLSSVTVPGGTTTSYTYDEEGNLLTLTNTKSDGTVLDSFTYTYSDDTLGVKNRISKTETVGGVQGGTTSYEYDGLGRLTKVVTPDGVQNVYTYDGAGNRLTKTSTAGEESAVTEYTYDEQNRLLNTSAYVTGETDEVNTYYGYDNNGNQISRWTQTEKTSGTEDAVTLSELGINAADETAVYEYDVFNRLTAIYQGDTIIENTYDGAGDNISRVEDGVPVYYVYDGNTVILELDGNGAEKARNVYGRNLIAREVDGVTAIYRYNGHGDVITIMGTDGNAISSYEYDEFGNETASTGTFDNPYRYAGYEYLDEVELYDLNARYYDPSIARFLTEDPYYNLGNRVMGVYEINVPNVYSIMQDNSSDHGPNNSHYSGGYNERKTDSYQLRLIVDYNLDLDCFVSEAVRLNTDNMIYGDNPVKINERENPYNPNNSVTFAYSPNINAVLQSGNLYAYCINNPVILTDHTGLWTFGISFGTNANLFFSISLSIGFYIDDDFNFDIQYSYSIPGVDDTMSVGFLDAGAGISVQITDAEHVDDLLGASTSMGASVGSAVSLGVDLISFDDVVSDSSSDIDGFQVTAGLGAGVDIHVNKTKTKSLLN